MVRILVSNLGLSVRQRPLVYVVCAAIVTQLVSQPQPPVQRWPVVNGSPADKIAEAVSSCLVAAVPSCL